jgi:hypothetical protein
MVFQDSVSETVKNCVDPNMKNRLICESQTTFLLHTGPVPVRMRTGIVIYRGFLLLGDAATPRVLGDQCRRSGMFYPGSGSLNSLKKSHQKTNSLDPGSEIQESGKNSSRIRIPEVKSTGSWIRNTVADCTIFINYTDLFVLCSSP